MLRWLRQVWPKREIVVHVQVELEGEKIAQAVTRHQQRKRRRGSS